MEYQTPCMTCTKEVCGAKHRKEKESQEAFLERQNIASRLCRIHHTILVFSGKGGVGKSTISANLARALVKMGFRAGLMDIDLHGPSIPRLMGISKKGLEVGEGGIKPIEKEGLHIISLGLMLKREREAVIWRGPVKSSLIRRFIKDVDWPELDFLVIDTPPGTGDEHLSIASLIPGICSAIVVTTPQEIAIDDSGRSLVFCKELGIKVIGVLENMSGFVCPHCGRPTPIFGEDGGERLAREEGVPFLGKIPLWPSIVEASDHGHPETVGDRGMDVGKIFVKIAERVLGILSGDVKTSLR